MIKGLTIPVKPLLLEQCGYPINNPINHTRHRTVDDNRAGDCEHFCADAQDEAFILYFHCLRYSPTLLVISTEKSLLYFLLQKAFIQSS